MANEKTKTVTVADGVQVYTGAGAHPFRAGDSVTLPAEHADALVAQQQATLVPPPRPAALSEQRPETRAPASA